jgi:hypothetical protein
MARTEKQFEKAIERSYDKIAKLEVQLGVEAKKLKELEYELEYLKAKKSNKKLIDLIYQKDDKPKKKSNAILKEKRTAVRFDPEDLDIAFISLKYKDVAKMDKKTFHMNVDHVGLIFNESKGGCNLIFLNKKESSKFLPKGKNLGVIVGKLSPIKGQIAWRKNITSYIVSIGIEYLK